MSTRLFWLLCYLKSKPVNENGVPIKGYRQRMFRVWQEIGLFESTEQRICDKARAIRKNGWLSELEIEVIRRKINQEETGDTNIQGLGDATTDENMEDDEIQQEEGEFERRTSLEMVPTSKNSMIYQKKQGG